MYENINGNGEQNNNVINGNSGNDIKIGEMGKAINNAQNGGINSANGADAEVYVNLGGIGNSGNIYKKIDIGADLGANLQTGAEAINGVYGGIKLENAEQEISGVPAKITPWTKIKNALFKEFIPYQKKVFGEVRDFWKKESKIVLTPYEKKVFGEVRDFWVGLFKGNKKDQNGTNL